MPQSGTEATCRTKGGKESEGFAAERGLANERAMAEPKARDDARLQADAENKDGKKLKPRKMRAWHRNNI